jgi:hypothetical protein
MHGKAFNIENGDGRHISKRGKDGDVNRNMIAI